MKKILERLFQHQTLSKGEAKEVMINIAEGKYSDTEIASFTTVYLMRSISIGELSGFRDALKELVVPLDLSAFNLLDIVGTGGDGKNTFNISTLSSFIVAGAGQLVSKHGNYGATSITGSSNVLELLGYKFSTSNEKLMQELEEANICFMHAPIFHPALKVVSPVRKNLGIRTFFNLLGPLVNPALPHTQMIGVSNSEIGRLYGYLLQDGEINFSIIHSMDGYDEISLTADCKVIFKSGEHIYSAYQLGKRNVSPSDISGGTTPDESAKVFLNILKGKGSWAQNAVVLANAAMALFTTGNFGNYEECYMRAVESFESGEAYKKFEKLMNLQK